MRSLVVLIASEKVFAIKDKSEAFFATFANSDILFKFKLEGFTFFAKAVTTDGPSFRAIERAEQAILCSMTICGPIKGGGSLRKRALSIARKGIKKLKIVIRNAALQLLSSIT